MDTMEQYLRAVELVPGAVTDPAEYPWCLPAVRGLGRLALHPRCTFLVGENGSGKSTLLEAIAVAWGFNPEGGSINFNFATRETHSPLHRALKLTRGVRRPRDGYFLRAESLYNVATNMDELDEDPGYGPPIVQSYGGVSLHRQSHGEAFLSLVLHRFGGQGLYLLDEPEAALSPMRQMALLRRMDELIGKRSQFVIATHSPLLLAYPDACIYSLDGGPHPVAYRDTDHYRVTRAFLEHPEGILRQLLGEDEEE